MDHIYELLQQQDIENQLKNNHDINNNNDNQQSDSNQPIDEEEDSQVTH